MTVIEEELRDSLHDADLLSAVLDTLGTDIHPTVGRDCADSLRDTLKFFNAQLEYYLPLQAKKSQTEWIDLIQILSEQADWLRAEESFFVDKSRIVSRGLERLAESRHDLIPDLVANSLIPEERFRSLTTFQIVPFAA